MLVRVVPFVAFGVLVMIGVLVVLRSAAAAPGDTVADRVFGQVSLNGIGCNQSGPTPNPGDTFPTSASTLCHSGGVACRQETSALRSSTKTSGRAHLSVRASLHRSLADDRGEQAGGWQGQRAARDDAR
jgi:hypothetical protein